MLHDLRYAVRNALRDRGVFTAAVVTLALGIGANTALFTIVKTVILAPLPFRAPEQLVRVTAEFSGQRARDAGLSIPELFDLQRSGVFEEIAGAWPVSANLTETDEPERVETALVDANYFSMLGVGAQIGRVFQTADAIPGIAEVAVISDGLWKRRFGADRNALGKRIRIDNDMYTIIGVAPAWFRHPARGVEADVDVWAPAGWLASPFSPQPVRRAYLLEGGFGRLNDGISPEVAQQRIDALCEQLRREFPSDYPTGAGWRLRVIPLHDDLVGDVRPALLTLLAAVALVLLIACANVANLLLARSCARQREIAIRRALGAGRGRLIRQLITESALLATVGGALGLLVAVWGVDALVRLSPSTVPRLRDVTIDGAVLAFTAVVSLVTGALFGIAPAVQGSRVDLQSAMRESSATTAGSPRATRVRGALVVGEFALALLLLVAAALLGQSFWRLQRVALGFNPASVLTAQLWLPQPNVPASGPYFTHDARVNFYRRVIDRVGVLPGVEAVGGISSLPLDGRRARFTFAIEGRAVATGATPAADLVLVSPGYFRALGIDLLRGRLFDDHDDGRSPGAVVVSDRFARQFFAGDDPVGKRIGPGAGRTPGGPQQAVATNWLTIVGVVRDVRSERLEGDAAPLVYRPLFQVSNLALTLVVRAAGDPTSLGEAIRREVKAVDPNEPVFNVRTMDAVVASAVATRRFTMLLLALFAATALGLSAVGIYGVMAYFVVQRTAEIGIRIALGATPGNVVAMVLSQGVRLSAAGIVLGLIGVVPITRLIGALLYEVSPRDPYTLLALSAVLGAVTLVACYIPARRATRLDPIRALRPE